MTIRIGQNINTYDAVSGSDTALNTTNFVEMADSNPVRPGYTISNPTAHDIIVKEQAHDSPDTTTPIGFIVFKRSVYETPADRRPIGKISALALTGTPTIKFMEGA